MNRDLYHLCNDYVNCFNIVQLMISVAGVESERLKVMRIMQDKMRELEHEMEKCIVENDLAK